MSPFDHLPPNSIKTRWLKYYSLAYLFGHYDRIDLSGL